MIILDTETVDLPTMAGPMRTHLFRPAAPGRYPGLVLYSEIFQVTGPIRRTAAMMAGHGFSVAVPEVYHELEAPGTVLGYTPEGSARGNAHKVAKSLDSYDSDARACIAFHAHIARMRVLSTASSSRAWPAPRCRRARARSRNSARLAGKTPKITARPPRCTARPAPAS